MSETRDPAAGSGAPLAAEGDGDLRSLIAGITREQVASSATSSASSSEPTPAEDDGGAASAAADDQAAPPSKPPPQAAPKPSGEPAGEPARRAGETIREVKEGAAAAPAEALAAKADEPPPYWDDDDRKLLDALPASSRADALKVARAREAKLVPQLERAAQLAQHWTPVEQMFTPEQRAILQQKGIGSPAQMVQIWHSVELRLAHPQTQDDQFARIVAGYSPDRAASVARIIHMLGLDSAEVARHLNMLRGFADPGPVNGGAAPGGGVGNGVSNVVLHPQVAARLDALETERQMRELSETQARNEAAAQELGAFANETDADGNLTHPYFGELRDTMIGLARLERERGQRPDLAKLYRQALYMSDATRERQLAADRAAEAKTEAVARKAKADAARLAGSSVNGAPSPGQLPGSAPERSIRDDIRFQLNSSRH